MAAHYIRLDVLRSGSGRYFRVVATNGKVLCHSEVYNRLRPCLRGAFMALGMQTISADYLIAGESITIKRIGTGAEFVRVVIEP